MTRSFPRKLPAAFRRGALGLLCVLPLACAGRQYQEVPAWIDTPPVDDSYLYETGSFWGSLNPSDNEKNALKVAYARLAHAVESRVRSRVTIQDFGSDRRGQAASSVRTEISIQNAQHLETWRDVDGLKGPRNQVWVLVRIERP